MAVSDKGPLFETQTLGKNGVPCHVWLFNLVLILSALMPFVPDKISVSTVAFSAAFLVFWLWGFVIHALSTRRFVLPAESRWLFGFLAVVGLSAIVAHLYGTNLSMWFRGAIPFFFLTSLILLAPRLTLAGGLSLLRGLHIAAIVWSVKVLIEVGLALNTSGLETFERLTHLTMNLTIPFSLVGLTLSLFNPDPPIRRFRSAQAAYFLCLIIASGYRSQGLIAGAILAYYWVSRRQELSARSILVATVVGVGALTCLAYFGVLSAFVARFQDIRVEMKSSRILEIKYAYDQFLQSPLLGKGLGNPVPVEVTFAGDMEFIARAVNVDTVGYIHNLPMYLLMDLGLWGFIAYFGLIADTCLRGRNARRYGEMASAQASMLRRAALVVVIGLMTFFCVQASFRHIQSNLILAACLSVLMVSRRVQVCGATK